jgi:amino acid transporter
MEEYLNTLNFSQLVGHLIAVIVLLQFFIFILWKRNEVLPDLRGKDKTWQFIELSGIVWLLIFPPMVITSGMGIDYPSGAWATMDIVYFINILGKRADRFIMAKYNIKDDKNDSEQT